VNRIWSRLAAIGVSIVLVTAVRLLGAAGLEYAFEVCAFAAFTAAIVLAAAGHTI
jgi:hypothetical protein